VAVLLTGSWFTRPRRRAKLSSPDRLALREDLLEVILKNVPYPQKKLTQEELAPP
jgi:hypothetical protein